MSGNERTLNNFTAVGSKVKAGYKVRPDDAFALDTDLQNFSNTEKFVWQTITYDIIDGPAKDYKPSQVVWLTIGNLENPSIGLCHYFNFNNPFGASNLTSKDLPKSLKFAEHSKIWKSDREGNILSSGGHLHAGGVNMEIFKNDKMFCNSTASYGKPSPGSSGHSHGPMGPMGPMKFKRQVQAGNWSNSELEFIESMSMCNYPEGIPIKKGDALYIQSNYDLERHKG